ncbi:MAG: flagellar hook-length control protein FliK [Candidatus Zixiibacteriota bacterium]|nr:MAG: flagellar hook-length control protein FliK [candidate division Zixibacteria bacterium]
MLLTASSPGNEPSAGVEPMQGNGFVFDTDLSPVFQAAQTVFSAEDIESGLNIRKAQVRSGVAKYATEYAGSREDTPLPARFQESSRLPLAALPQEDRPVPVRVHAARAGGLDGIPPDQMVSAGDVERSPSTSPEKAPAEVIELTQFPRRLPSENASGIDFKSIAERMLPTSAMTSAVTKSASSKTDAPAVRFILPIEIKPNSIRSGHTVTIKMEPAHLGSVRLTLSSRNETVVGRLVVDSSAARSLVESNLHILYDQLSREGIRMDAFQVTVGGGETGPRFTQRRATQGMRGQSGWRRERETAQKIKGTGNSHSASHMYVGSTGVDWIV